MWLSLRSYCQPCQLERHNQGLGFAVDVLVLEFGERTALLVMQCLKLLEAGVQFLDQTSSALPVIAREKTQQPAVHRMAGMGSG